MRFRPTFAAAACLMLALAACSNPADPTQTPEPEVAKTTKQTPGPDQTRETRTLGPSLSPWEGPQRALPGDEVVVLEELERMQDRAESDGAWGLGTGGGRSARRVRSGDMGPPPPSSPEAAKASKEPSNDSIDKDESDDSATRLKAGVDPTLKASEGSLFARKGADYVGQFPLEHTDVKAEISGYIGATTVTQSFTNPFTEVIEAVYTFPLPGDAAINDFLMVIGERRIRGIIRPRAEAERIYAEARARGFTASLLTQERPNIFTQNVANIEVGGAVDIAITYFQTLGYEDGRYEYYFPMVVGPRYIPGAPSKDSDDAERNDGGAKVGGEGVSPNTDKVPDAGKITPPMLPEGMRSGHDISLTLDIDAGMAIDQDSLESIAHKVQIESVSDQRIVVALTDADNILNRDFVFRWGMNNDKPVGGVLTHRSDKGGFFTLMLQPQLNPADKDVTPREVTFIMDVSGSMNGLPMDASKEVVGKSLDTLRPGDIFNIVYFASGNGQVFEKPMPNTPENIEKAKAFLQQRKAGGGTEMLAGLQRALKAEHDPAYLQMYTFFTDGYIGNEAEIHKTVQENSDAARFFAFGIGGSVNRHLIDGIGENGRGKVHYCFPRDAKMGERAAKTFYDMIDSPVLCDIEIDWNGLPVKDVYGTVNDLFAGQPIQLCGRYEGSGEGTIYINGRVGANYITIPVHVVLPEQEERNECLGAIWARKRIADIEKQLLAKPDDKQLEQQGEDLALEFNLMSRWTSFVAVDESRIVGDGSPIKVMQPVELPDGVDRAGIEGTMDGKPMSIGGWGMVVMQNKQGGVAVVYLDKGREAEQAGVEVGQLVATIDGVAVMGLSHLNGLLMQTSGKVKVGFNIPEGEAHKIREVEMPQP
ncbi:MAG: VWA domain-containing protein [Planctomycetes bacterium]|nr:VWA domain-containing protein [Planctomycetota bacterium]